MVESGGAVGSCDLVDYGVEGHWAVAWSHLVVRGRGRDVTHVIDIVGYDDITYTLLRTAARLERNTILNIPNTNF